MQHARKRDIYFLITPTSEIPSVILHEITLSTYREHREALLIYHHFRNHLNK